MIKNMHCKSIFIASVVLQKYRKNNTKESSKLQNVAGSVKICNYICMYSINNIFIQSQEIYLFPNKINYNITIFILKKTCIVKLVRL